MPVSCSRQALYTPRTKSEVGRATCSGLTEYPQPVKASTTSETGRDGNQNLLDMAVGGGEQPPTRRGGRRLLNDGHMTGGRDASRVLGHSSAMKRPLPLPTSSIILVLIPSSFRPLSPPPSFFRSHHHGRPPEDQSRRDPAQIRARYFSVHQTCSFYSSRQRQQGSRITSFFTFLALTRGYRPSSSPPSPFLHPRRPPMSQVSLYLI